MGGSRTICNRGRVGAMEGGTSSWRFPRPACMLGNEVLRSDVLGLGNAAMGWRRSSDAGSRLQLAAFRFAVDASLPHHSRCSMMKRTASFGRGVQLVLLVPTLLFSGCAASDDPDESAEDRSREAQASNQDFDPCALVTTGEAAEALGVATAEADRPSEANNEMRSESYSGGEDMLIRLRTCRYTGAIGQGVAVLTVMVRQSSSPAESEIGFEGLRETYTETVGVTDVPGLGDQAFWLDEPARGIQVLSDGVQLSIGGDIDADEARDLAAKALGRLE